MSNPRLSSMPSFDDEKAMYKELAKRLAERDAKNEHWGYSELISKKTHNKVQLEEGVGSYKIHRKEKNYQLLNYNGKKLEKHLIPMKLLNLKK